MTTQITTKNDQYHTGYVISEEGSEITLRSIPTKDFKKIAKASVIDRVESGSVMVAGLTSMLTDRELADLIKYLSSLKKN